MIDRVDGREPGRRGTVVRRVDPSETMDKRGIPIPNRYELIRDCSAHGRWECAARDEGVDTNAALPIRVLSTFERIVIR
jgi:hypothetical protein